MGDEWTVEFTLLGCSFLGLNGAPAITPNEAISFQVLTEKPGRKTRTPTNFLLYLASRIQTSTYKPGHPRISLRIERRWASLDLETTEVQVEVAVIEAT